MLPRAEGHGAPAPREVAGGFTRAGAGVGAVLRLSLLVVLVTLFAPRESQGQVLIDFRQDLAFDRPEAWAMKYFATVAQLSPLGPPPDLEPGGLEVALEGGWIPSLSDEDRTVGFLGTKAEHLNRTSFFGRGRATVGLPGDFALTLGYVPRIDVGGIEPHLVGLSLRRPLWQGPRWRLGAGVSASWGSFQGDITCPAAQAAAGQDPERNPFKCHEPSRDRMTFRQGGLEVTLSTPLASGVEPYVAVTASYLDSRFRVHARHGELIDRSLLVTDGVTWATSAGVSYSLRGPVRLAGELFYAPLSVVRPPAESRTNDALFNARALLAWRVR